MLSDFGICKLLMAVSVITDIWLSSKNIFFYNLLGLTVIILSLGESHTVSTYKMERIIYCSIAANFEVVDCNKNTGLLKDTLS